MVLLLLDSPVSEFIANNLASPWPQRQAHAHRARSEADICELYERPTNRQKSSQPVAAEPGLHTVPETRRIDVDHFIRATH